jgi:hypothetical protein
MITINYAIMMKNHVLIRVIHISKFIRIQHSYHLLGIKITNESGNGRTKEAMKT